MHSSAGQGGLCLQAPSVPLLGPPVSAEPPATHISAHSPPAPPEPATVCFSWCFSPLGLVPAVTPPCPLQRWREPNGDTDLPGLPLAPAENRAGPGCLRGDPPADEKLLPHDPHAGRWQGGRAAGWAGGDIGAELPPGSHTLEWATWGFTPCFALPVALPATEG